MATDILKRSPEEVKAAYDQAFSDLKKALGIDSRNATKDEIMLGDWDEENNPDGDISGFIKYDYSKGKNYEQIVITVSEASSMVCLFTLDEEGLRNYNFSRPSFFVGNNEVKLKDLELGDPHFSQGGPQLDWEDDQVTVRQLAGIDLASWVTKSLNDNKLGPSPVRLIKESTPEEPHRDPIN